MRNTTSAVIAAVLLALQAGCGAPAESENGGLRGMVADIDNSGGMQLAMSGTAHADDVALAAKGTDAVGKGKLTSGLPTEQTVVKVYKTKSCGCCSRWVDHMRAAGFAVEAEDVDQRELVAIKLGAGLWPEMYSCHTAMAGGYVFEGHIPADVVSRFLSEEPEWLGLAVPGMPVGSPGMEAGDRVDPYDVVAFGKERKTEVFEKR